MKFCNVRQAVMSALEALVLAGKGMNAFSVLFCSVLHVMWIDPTRRALAEYSTLEVGRTG
jgi:hypothetical protein